MSTVQSETNARHDASAGVRWISYWLILAVFLALATAATLNAQPLQSANDRSRWSTVLSLVEDRTYRIDAIDAIPRWSTIDKVRHQAPGESEYHFYSSKPPLLATMVAGVYWSFKCVGGWDLRRDTHSVAQSILLFVNVLPMFAALLVLIRFVERYADTDFARLFVVATGAFGTLLTPFLVTLNNHTVAAVCAVPALYCTARIAIDRSRSAAHFAATGFFAALACAFELPAALFAVIVFGFLAHHDRIRTLKWFVPAALIPLAAFFITNGIVTGGWKPFYAYFGSDKYFYTHEGVPSYWSNPSAVDAGLDALPVYFLHCTIGHHGILSLSPVFLLTVASWVLPRTARNEIRPFVRMALVLTVIVLAFYLTRTSSYNFGGVSSGLRWMFWLIPFLLISMLPLLDRFAHAGWFRCVSICLLAMSGCSMASALGNPWQQPWLFRVLESAGWIRYENPRSDDRRVFPTWFPDLPDVSTSADPVWVEFRSVDVNGNEERLRLTATAGGVTAGRELFNLQVRRERTAATTSKTYAIDTAAFRSGAGPERFLVFTDGRPSATRMARINAFFWGVPAARNFETGVTRYVKLPLRRDAFACTRAATRVRYAANAADTTDWYRCDLWLTGEVPFGVLQWEQTVTTESGTVRARRRFTVVDWSGRNSGARSTSTKGG